MRVAIVGGGPGGLLLGTLLRRRQPDAEVVVLERNRATDAFGFGVVFSNATLGEIDAADPVLRNALLTHGQHWDAIEVRVHGQRRRCGGNGMAAIVRSTLLRLLQEQARDEGVELRFETEVGGPEELADFDLVVAADGANSRLREARRDVFDPHWDTASAKFIWLGTTYPYDGLTFVHQDGPHGVFAAHAYPITDGLSTFIVETDEDSWRRAGLDRFDVTQPPGPSDEVTRRYLEELFAEQLDGHRLIGNNSRWGNFRTLRTGRWSDGRLVLLGDAAHTAHFSVGSGTKMAMEDAIVLARTLGDHAGDVPAALAAYEAERRPRVEHVQGAAGPSLSWWEHFGRYHRALDATQFTFHFLSRSITRERLRRRDPEFVAEVDHWWRERHGAPPLETPLETPAGTVPRRRGRLDAAGGRICVADRVLPLVALDGDANAPPDAARHLRLPDEVADRRALEEWLRTDLRGCPLLVVDGGDPLTRTLVSEWARMEAGVPTALVTDVDDDAAETLVLSGRADLVLGAGGAA
ncbi:FAD-dependent monooxygenase [Egicoccus sp. AB-alg2]|uniref:FAD-dependent monooxygenase n=1 Tax=Egicoccus sp. AB-alg2 TaxID=3242693 RepID=UPI00359CECA7